MEELPTTRPERHQVRLRSGSLPNSARTVPRPGLSEVFGSLSEAIPQAAVNEVVETTLRKTPLFARLVCWAVAGNDVCARGGHDE
jgi:hypothetical protein